MYTVQSIQGFLLGSILNKIPNTLIDIVDSSDDTCYTLQLWQATNQELT
jgi:hypothetical protein